MDCNTEDTEDTEQDNGSVLSVTSVFHNSLGEERLTLSVLIRAIHG